MQSPSYDRGLVHLLRLDPELGRGLGGRALAEAEARLVVPAQRVAKGAWVPNPPAQTGPASQPFLLLVVDGLLMREVTVSGAPCAELLGPGDVVRPWDEDRSETLPSTVRWAVVAPAVVAFVDRNALRAFPDVGLAMVERANRRADRIVRHQAISQLTRVDDRLLALFWSLAERYGKVSAQGIVLHLRLPHRALGAMVGARRPSVTTALGQLEARGVLARREDGAWLLTGEPPAAERDADGPVEPEQLAPRMSAA